MELIAMFTPDRLIADSKGIEQFLKNRHFRMPPCNVIAYGAPVIDHPPDSQLLKEWKLEPGKYFLVVCRIEPENHVFEIVKGFSLSESKIPLVVVGNLNHGYAYVEFLDQIKDPRIKYIGGVYDRTKLQALRYYCSAYFHGHSVGGTNPSLLEAMGCGNVIIAHDNPFNREVAGDLAIYFKSISDIAEIIKTLDPQYSPEIRPQHSEKLISRVKEQYSWEKIVDMYLDLIKTNRT